MTNSAGPLRRYEGNPILTPRDMPFRCYSVFNAGATLFEGKVLLLLRVEDCRRRTDFYVATSEDGYHFEVRPEPIHYPLREVEKRYGTHRFDMRITPLDGTYYVCHAVWLGAGLGCTIGIAKTDDFVHFEPLEYTSAPSNRNAVLFPEKINGRYVRLERPQDTEGGGRMWVSESPDLVYWGRTRPVDMPIPTWAHRKSGAGCVPIKTDRGWLEIYHGVGTTCSTENYYLGALLLDLEDPSKCVACPQQFILAAEEPYECMGQTPNVVFAGGAVQMPDGRLLVYYGGADTVMAVAETTVDELVEFCLSAD